AVPGRLRFDVVRDSVALEMEIEPAFDPRFGLVAPHAALRTPRGHLIAPLVRFGVQLVELARRHDFPERREALGHQPVNELILVYLWMDELKQPGGVLE